VLERSIEGEDLEETIGLYEKATRLSSHRARYWAELGGAYDLAGRPEDARRAYEQAQQLFPNSPRINWQLGNFYIRQGKTAKALPAFQKVLLGDPRLRLPAFDLAWRAGVDADLILQRMIPPNVEILFQYLNHLVRKERMGEAEQAWARVLELGLPLEPRRTFRYLNALIHYKRVDELTAAWNAVKERNPIRIRQRRLTQTS
jgi:tetratricopeptide (TPR) repeat protein